MESENHQLKQLKLEIEQLKKELSELKKAIIKGALCQR